jgi:hypothetical protein
MKRRVEGIFVSGVWVRKRQRNYTVEGQRDW